MLEQVIMNLAVNARDAMPSGGTLSIHLDPVEVDAGLRPGPSGGHSTGSMHVRILSRRYSSSRSP